MDETSNKQEMRNILKQTNQFPLSRYGLFNVHEHKFNFGVIKLKFISL